MTEGKQKISEGLKSTALGVGDTVGFERRLTSAENTIRQNAAFQGEDHDELKGIAARLEKAETKLKVAGVPLHGLIYTFCAVTAVVSTAILLVGALFGLVPLTWSVAIPAAAMLGFAVTYRTLTNFTGFLIKLAIIVAVCMVLIGGIVAVAIPLLILFLLGLVIKPARGFFRSCLKFCEGVFESLNAFQKKVIAKRLASDPLAA